LFKIRAASIAVLEFKRDAPRAVNVDRVASRPKPSQRMKIETRKIHLLGPHRDIEAIEPT
jgi:hypothetical protein